MSGSQAIAPCDAMIKIGGYIWEVVAIEVEAQTMFYWTSDGSAFEAEKVDMIYVRHVNPRSSSWRRPGGREAEADD